ncbi:MAG: hypothetical protein HYY46_18470 [Deltaproteobacteria bacterium]|nr:hypothetical protein [Deltaproteobacteria bacterium]
MPIKNGHEATAGASPASFISNSCNYSLLVFAIVQNSANDKAPKRASVDGMALARVSSWKLSGVRGRGAENGGRVIEMMYENKSEKIETTLGELIAALTDAAVDVTGDDQRGAYLLAYFALEEILRSAPLRGDIGPEIRGGRWLEKMRDC